MNLMSEVFKWTVMEPSSRYSTLLVQVLNANRSRFGFKEFPTLSKLDRAKKPNCRGSTSKLPLYLLYKRLQTHKSTVCPSRSKYDYSQKIPNILIYC